MYKENNNQTVKIKDFFVLVSNIRDITLYRKEKNLEVKIQNELSIPHFLFRHILYFIFENDPIKITIFRDQAKEILCRDEQKRLINL